MNLWQKMKFLFNAPNELRKLQDRYYSLYDDIECIKAVLEKQRLANFIHIVNYSKDLKLSYERPPEPINLEELQTRIEELEKSDK